jgi:hypothetical protein
VHYGESLNDMLRDKLVCGVNHDAIQQKLMSQTPAELTFAKAMELAQRIEIAEKDARRVTASTDGSQKKDSPNPSASEVHKTHTSRRKNTKKESRDRSTSISCHRCGGPHLAPACKFKEAMCYACKKRGHIARVCRSRSFNKGQKRDKGTHHLEDQDDSDGSDGSDDQSYTLFTVRESASEPIYQEVLINTIPVKMEVDTGASVSVITHSTYQKIRECTDIQPLQPSVVKLKAYTGEVIPVLGQVPVKVSCGQKDYQFTVQVVESKGPDLMGRNWLRDMKVTLEGLHSLEQPDSLKQILRKHSSVFKSGLGCLQGAKVKLHVKSDVLPKFYKARPVPLALKKKVEDELDRLQGEGIISPVQFSKWAAPIVPVMKRDQSVRICGDFRITANVACQVDSYPLPRIEELLANLAGGKCFSKLDMSQAYLQLPLDDESAELVTVNTHKGLFRYNRLPFGVASAPSIFQRYMESLLQGIDGVSVYIDDILVTGSTVDEHICTLDKVLERIVSAGLTLNKSKCYFLRPRIEYLGHIIDEEGLRPTEEKVKAIKEAPKPKNVAELRSFLGIINADFSKTCLHS